MERKKLKDMEKDNKVFTEQEERKIKDLENAGIISMFLAVKFAHDLASNYSHVFTQQLRNQVYSKEFEAEVGKKNVRASQKRFKQILGEFSKLRSSESEVLKIASLNEGFAKIFEGNSIKLYKDLEKKFKRSILLIVNQLGEETYKSKDVKN